MSDLEIKSKIWIIKDKNNKLIDNIDTDQIFHNDFLTITEQAKMGKYTFSNLSEWKDFPTIIDNRKIIIVGENFGQGSSRQQAVDCFISLGIKLIIAKSFGAIYWRNAINSGLCVLKCPDIDKIPIVDGDELMVSLASGTIIGIRENNTYQAIRLSTVEMEILKNGGLFNYAKAQNGMEDGRYP